jgi:sigma-B regulation protein RsbU (phosphoserine phosphatase)
MDVLEHTTIDLIILDLIMPVIDGYQVLKLIKKNPRISDIPVIVNSAITEIKSIENTLKEGAIDYFTKPLSPNDMKIILPLKAKNALLVYEQTRTIAELNRKINDELKNANTFANIMLPKSKTLNGIELYIKYHPSLGIGGDFFDCVEIDGKTHFMLADVTGHGIAAGMASSMVKILYRKSIVKQGIKPHEILEDMNRSIFEIFDFTGHMNYFVFTAFVGIIENGVLSFANAGHPYPLVYHQSKSIFEEIRENGFLVGMMDDVSFETKEISVAKDDLIFLYTDGLFCSGEKGDFTGWEKVLSLSRRLKHSLEEEPDDFLEEIFYAFHMIHKSHHSEFTDDVALMLLKIK